MNVISEQRSDIKIVLSQGDFDRAIAEMPEEEFADAWHQLGKLVRIRARRISELWDQGQVKCSFRGSCGNKRDGACHIRISTCSYQYL